MMTYHSQQWKHKVLDFSLDFTPHLLTGTAPPSLNVVDKGDKND